MECLAKQSASASQSPAGAVLSRGQTLQDFEILDVRIFGIDVEFYSCHWDVD